VFLKTQFGDCEISTKYSHFNLFIIQSEISQPLINSLNCIIYRSGNCNLSNFSISTMFSAVLKRVRIGKPLATEIIHLSKREFASKKSKQPKTRLLVKAALVVELGLFIGSYLVWKRMNSSQDFRFYMRNNYPQILEGNLCLISFNQSIFI
jgi:hypothetical protein